MSLLQEMEKYGLSVCPANEPYIATAHIATIKIILGHAIEDFERDDPVNAAEHVIAAYNLVKEIPCL